MKILLILLLGLRTLCAQAEIVINDDRGTAVKLAAPAQRIVSLAPHITEVLFAAGAGGRIVGTVEYSDYPEAAQKIRRVGGYSRLDLEAIAALKPDLIVGAGDIGSRHDAMQKGELDIDYILFGPLSGAISQDEREMARWWAETMEIPSVLSDPSAGYADHEAEGCEFIGIGLDLSEKAE